jgi:hypothetical protein
VLKSKGEEPSLEVKKVNEAKEALAEMQKRGKDVVVSVLGLVNDVCPTLEKYLASLEDVSMLKTSEGIRITRKLEPTDVPNLLGALEHYCRSFEDEDEESEGEALSDSDSLGTVPLVRSWILKLRETQSVLGKWSSEFEHEIQLAAASLSGALSGLACCPAADGTAPDLSRKSLLNKALAEQMAAFVGRIDALDQQLAALPCDPERIGTYETLAEALRFVTDLLTDLSTERQHPPATVASTDGSVGTGTDVEMLLLRSSAEANTRMAAGIAALEDLRTDEGAAELSCSVAFTAALSAFVNESKSLLGDALAWNELVAPVLDWQPMPDCSAAVAAVASLSSSSDSSGSSSSSSSSSAARVLANSLGALVPVPSREADGEGVGDVPGPTRASGDKEFELEFESSLAKPLSRFARLEELMAKCQGFPVPHSMLSRLSKLRQDALGLEEETKTMLLGGGGREGAQGGRLDAVDVGLQGQGQRNEGRQGAAGGDSDGDGDCDNESVCLYALARLVARVSTLPIRLESEGRLCAALVALAGIVQHSTQQQQQQQQQQASSSSSTSTSATSASAAADKTTTSVPASLPNNKRPSQDDLLASRAALETAFIGVRGFIAAADGARATVGERAGAGDGDLPDSMAVLRKLNILGHRTIAALEGRLATADHSVLQGIRARLNASDGGGDGNGDARKGAIEGKALSAALEELQKLDFESHEELAVLFLIEAPQLRSSMSTYLNVTNLVAAVKTSNESSKKARVEEQERSKGSEDSDSSSNKEGLLSRGGMAALAASLDAWEAKSPTLAAFKQCVATRATNAPLLTAFRKAMASVELAYSALEREMAACAAGNAVNAGDFAALLEAARGTGVTQESLLDKARALVASAAEFDAQATRALSSLSAGTDVEAGAMKSSDLSTDWFAMQRSQLEALLQQGNSVPGSQKIRLALRQRVTVLRLRAKTIASVEAWEALAGGVPLEASTAATAPTTTSSSSSSSVRRLEEELPALRKVYTQISAPAAAQTADPTAHLALAPALAAFRLVLWRAEVRSALQQCQPLKALAALAALAAAPSESQPESSEAQSMDVAESGPIVEDSCGGCSAVVLDDAEATRARGSAEWRVLDSAIQDGRSIEARATALLQTFDRACEDSAAALVGGGEAATVGSTSSLSSSFPAERDSSQSSQSSGALVCWSVSGAAALDAAMGVWRGATTSFSSDAGTVEAHAATCRASVDGVLLARLQWAKQVVDVLTGE